MVKRQGTCSRWPSPVRASNTDRCVPCRHRTMPRACGRGLWNRAHGMVGPAGAVLGPPQGRDLGAWVPEMRWGQTRVQETVPQQRGRGCSALGRPPAWTVRSNDLCASCHLQDLRVFYPGPSDNVKLREPPRSSLTN